MPENTKENTNKPVKARLGRGLNSLFGGDTGQSSSTEHESATNSSSHQKTAQLSPETGMNNQTTQNSDNRKSTLDNQNLHAHSAVSKIAEEAQIWNLAIDKLRANTQQPRQIFTSEGLKDLTASIKEKGILQPIVARRINEREFEIIAGERRWRAAQAAGFHEVPVILKKVTEQDALEYAIIENIQRENLNPLEEAEAYEHLLNDYSLTQQQIADRLGKERSTVANTLRLLSLPIEVKAHLKRSEISAGHAKVLLGLDKPADQIFVANQIVEQKLSVRAAEKLVAKTKSAGRSEQNQSTGSNSEQIGVNVSQRLIESLSAELQKLIGTKVAIDYASGKGKLSVHFYSDDQLTDLVDKMKKSWAN